MQLFARTCKFERMNFERLFARLFVAGGGLFWFIAALGAWSRYLDDGSEVFRHAWIILAATVIILALGWFYEVAAALVLFALTVVFIVYGFLQPTIGEAGVWSIWLLFTAAPAATAGVLFLLASRMQLVCELEDKQA